MNVKFKLYAYAALAILALCFGLGFYSCYRDVTKAAADTGSSASPTNTSPAQGQNAAPSTAPAPRPRQGAMIAYLAAFVLSLAGLGILIAIDFTHYMGSQAVDLLFDDRGEGMRDPEYEQAEQTWANGDCLEAVRMMRDYLKKNPRELYVSFRIAEIYEKDLENHLAAALEYEDILKHRLPAERWSWGAIHLCNLYSKLGQQDKARALLQRIADEHPKTGAAKKARAHLGLPEPEEPATPPAESESPAAEQLPAQAYPTRAQASEAEAATPSEPEPEPPPAPPARPALPPGFRPKK